MPKLKMHTQDNVTSNIDKISLLFPHCITEHKNSKGELEKVIDFDMLKQELSAELVEGPNTGEGERYQFTWPDKKQSVLQANLPINKTLRPCREESVNFDSTENLYIEGDNLEVLKILQETYLGKVKMIYIDPPYNTGKDFVYSDNFTADKDEYLEDSGQFDDEGNRLFQNTESNGRFHTDWLNMMYPRLKIARNLLSDDGVIFISIDDNEVHNLRKICDEVFGAGNFVAELIWQKKFSRANDASYFSTMHDYILCYSKLSKLFSDDGWNLGLLPRGEDIPVGYSNPDNDIRGVWTSVVLSAKSGSNKLIYEIKTPSGRVCVPPSGRFWSVNQEKLNSLIIDNRIWFGINGDGTPRLKTFLSEVQDGLRPNTILFHNEVGHNQEGKQETKKLFDDLGVFESPKPVRLLKTLLQIANTNPSDIILDFFSGSATTAHAVMQLNAEDGGNRKFIMVQVPEKTDEKSEAFKANYANICEIGKERIRRAGAKIKEENPLTTQDLDCGFRVLKVDSTNMTDVYYKPQELEQNMLVNLAQNIKADRTSEDLLFQVMLDLGIPLSEKIEEIAIDNKKVFSVADNFLIACFDTDINDTTIEEIAKKEPQYFVMRDSSMINDSVATNFEQYFETYSPHTVRSVL